MQKMDKIDVTLFSIKNDIFNLILPCAFLCTACLCVAFSKIKKLLCPTIEQANIPPPFTPPLIFSKQKIEKLKSISESHRININDASVSNSQVRPT